MGSYSEWRKNRVAKETGGQQSSDRVSYIVNRHKSAMAAEQQKKAETEKLNKINGIINEIDSRTQKLFKDYSATAEEKAKFVSGEASTYDNPMKYKPKFTSKSYVDEANSIKSYIEENKDYLSGEQYLAAMQNVNAFLDTDFTDSDKAFNEYYNAVQKSGGKENFDKAVEEYREKQATLKKAGLNKNSTYAQIESVVNDTSTDAGAGPLEQAQGRAYKDRRLSSEEKDYLRNLLKTEEKVSTMTTDEVISRVEKISKNNSEESIKSNTEKIYSELTSNGDDWEKLEYINNLRLKDPTEITDDERTKETEYAVYLREKYGIYDYSQNLKEQIEQKIRNDNKSAETAYYYTENGETKAMTWGNYLNERTAGEAYKSVTDDKSGSYNPEAAEIYNRLSQLDDFYIKTEGMTNPQSADSLYEERENLNKRFEKLTGTTFEAVEDYQRLQASKARSEAFTNTIDSVMEKLDNLPKWISVPLNIASGNVGGIASDIVGLIDENAGDVVKTVTGTIGLRPSVEGAAMVMSIPGAVLSGIDYVGNAVGNIGHNDPADYKNYRQLNIYNDYATLWAQQVSGKGQDMFRQDLLDLGLSEKTANNIARIGYGGLSSGLNSIAVIATSCALFGEEAGSVIGMIILSGQSASSTTHEAINNGSTAGEALMSGFAAGVAEYIGEKVSLGYFFDNILHGTMSAATVKEFFKSAGKWALGSAIEGSEEVFTSAMNRFADYIINSDHSNMELAVQNYISQGYSAEEAKNKAANDWWTETFYDFWGGFVGGSLMGGAALAGNVAVNTKNKIQDTAHQADIGKAITGTDAGKNVLELAEKRGLDTSKAAKEVSEGRGIGKLVSKVRNAVRNRNMGKLAQDVVATELKAAKETAMPIVGNENLAELVAEIATGTADVSAISVLGANGVLNDENADKVFEALEAVQERTENAEVRNMINDIVETKESSEGKAYNANNIYGIKREGGKTKYILEDGTEVDSGEFGLTSKDKTLFVNAVKNMTDAEANEMISAYRKYANGTDEGVFATTWGLYRSLGETGAAKNSERVAGYKSRIYFTDDAEVNNVLVASAIEQGVKARARNEKKVNIKARAERVIKERGRAKGEVRGEEHLGKNKSGAKTVSRTLAKLGYDVEFLSEDSKLRGKRIGDTKINGAYDAETNTIYLRADAEYNASDVRGILGHTLAHEITHSIKVWSESDYNVLTDYIRDALGADFDTLVRQKMNALGMDYGMATDEVIADGCEMLLRDSKALEKLAAENANLFVKIASKIKEFITKLRKAQADMYGGNEELHDSALRLREALKSLEKVQEVFDNALENSIRNMRDALAEAENAKTRENLDILEKQAEKEGLQLSEEIGNRYADYDKPITVYDVEVLRSIGRKSINSFTSEDIQKAAKWAYKFYKELGTKSPFFRAWFGDWRAKDTTAAKMIDTEGDLRSPSEKNEDTGWEIIISRQVSKETTHHSSDNVKNAVKYLPYIKDITQNAVLLDTYTSGKDNSLSLFFHSMYAYTEVMGYPALIKLKVEELINEKDGSSIRRDYILQNIEEKPISEVKRFSKALHHKKGFSEYRVSQLYSLVKRFDKDFSAGKSVDPVLLNKDGTPKVFYHGAKKNGGFTVFRNWQYFTDKKSYAERYAERGNSKALYAVYLTADKVFDTRDAQARDIYNSIRSEYGLSELQDTGLPDWTDGYDISEYLDEHPELGYDAIILDEGGDLVDGKPVSRGLSIVVKGSSQIKSATDNIGTFDKGNKDIRYSEETSEQRENALTSFTDDDVKKYVNKAVRRFHTTYSLKKAAYLTTTGSMLDFSDGQGYRVQDHREISDILDLPDDAGYSDGMIYFMNMGNIRLQTYGIDIAAMPNAKQVSMLRSIIPSIMRENDGFYLDVSDSRGNNVFSREYGEGTSTSKIISDIQNYFKDGTIPKEQSDLREFMFSEETSEEFAENEKSAIEKALANMSVKDYNRRGWLRTLLTREDASKLNSAVAETFTGKRRDIRLKDGSYAVEVNNKIVFVSGTFENPRYESVLVFNTDNATEMEIIKDHFFGSAAITGLTQKDIERFIKQRRGYGQVYGFNAEDYKASGRRDFGRAMLRSNTKGFGDISQFEVRDGVYTKDEGNVSLRVQGLKFSEETETSRDTLVSDMEAVAETDEEKSFVEKLKAEVEKANALQEELDEVNRKIKEASFTKGADRSVLPSLKEQKAQLVKKLNRLDSKFYGYRGYDSKFYGYRGYDTFKTLAERKSKDAVIAERLRGKEALRSQQQKYEEAAQSIKDTLAQREENRRRREIVRDIAKRLDAIDAKAKTDSKTKHIPSALRGVVAQFRMAVNTETQDYGKKIEAANESIEKYSNRLEKLNAALEEASAEEAAEIKERIDAVNAVIEQKQRAIENYKKYAVKANDYTDALTNFYNAYYEKSLENDYEKAYYADTEAVISAIEALKERIVGRSLYELNSEELQDVLDVTKMVQKSISNANKLFGETRSLADSVAKVADETEKYKALKKRRDKNLRPGEEKQKSKLGRWAEKNIKYNMLKPAELFLRSGSDTLYGLYKKLQRAEGDAAKLIEKYGNKYREAAKENGVTKKQFDTKHRIDLGSGMTVELTSGELMTLYATSRRKQGRQHLLGGGFRLSGGIIREVRNGKVEELKSYLCKLTEADLKKISDELEDNLKKFTETMQGYMSDEMAKDGNRVSMQLYDVALFNDKFYIPLDVDDSTRPTSIEKGKGNIKIINKGMTQSLNEKAANGVYISNFSDVFAKHAQDMSSYAAFTLPLENLERVLNSSADGVRIKAMIGENLSREIFDFLKDVNGGIKSDGVLTSRLFSLSKAARVGLNLRVIIQQPTAIIRAMSEIDPKYFFGTSTKGMSDTMKRKLLEEMHDYTSTWIVKSMGGIDVNTSKAISDQITDLGIRGNKLREIIPNSINKGSFYLAEKADQIAWMSLYAACKREARAQGFTGEYLLKRAGERFDEIVNKTQVYDSVFSRAKILRSQNWLNKLASMFMAEPLTTANMMMDAARLSSHGNSAKAARITASVALSIVITNAFAAIIDALRDDDDDETYGEKYLEAIIRNLMNDFDPATYIPFVRDVISLAQGYDIERADMSLISDFMTKGTNLIKAYKNGGDLADSWHKFAGSILDVTGIPFSSLYRDVKAIVNTVFRGQGRKVGDSTKTNAALGSLDAFAGEIPGYAVVYSPHSKSDKLYYAMVNGDDKYVKITKEEYADDEDKFNQLLKKGLKENDFRVAEAAQAHMDGDTEKYLELIGEVVKDGYDEKIVQGAILSAENKLNGEDENVDRAIDGMLATKGDIISALEKGDSKYLNDYYEAKVKKYSSREGKKDNPKKNALSATKAMLTDYYKPIYEEADSAERKRIRSILLKVKIDGKYLYDSSSFDNWDE